MKKLLLLAVMAVTLVSCSDDDKPVQQATGCQMKVLQIGNNGTTYDIQYGVSLTEYVSITVSKEVFDFYQARANAGNVCWIGEVSHE